MEDKKLNTSVFKKKRFACILLVLALIFFNIWSTESEKAKDAKVKKLVGEQVDIAFKNKFFEYNPMTPAFVTDTGAIRQRPVIWTKSVNITSAGGMVVDISKGNFTQIISAVATAGNNTSTVSSMPLISIKSRSLTTLTLNVVASNSQLLSIGQTLLGLIAPTNLTGMTADIIVIGYRPE